MDKLFSAAKRAIVQSLKVKKGEKLLLVTDRQKMKIAEALAYWANKSSAEVTTYLMTETVRPITAPTVHLQGDDRDGRRDDVHARCAGRGKAVPGVHGRERRQEGAHLHDAGDHGRHDGAPRQHRLRRHGSAHEEGDPHAAKLPRRPRDEQPRHRSHLQRQGPEVGERQRRYRHEGQAREPPRRRMLHLPRRGAPSPAASFSASSTTRSAGARWSSRRGSSSRSRGRVSPRS